MDYINDEEISRLSILRELLEQTEHNILCYSDNYLGTRPKKQYEKEWLNESKKAKVIKSMIKDEKAKSKNMIDMERREV